jgi:hypothetical protein
MLSRLPRRHQPGGNQLGVNSIHSLSAALVALAPSWFCSVLSGGCLGLLSHGAF